MTHALLVAASASLTGGGEKHIGDLLRMLPARGVRCSLVCPVPGDLPDLARESGAAVYGAPVGSARPSGILTLRRIIAEAAPDVVHAHGTRAAMFARLADSRARDRVVYTVHGIHVDQAGSAARRAASLGIERGLRNRTAHFIAVCNSDVRKGSRLGVLDESRTTVVYNGIEVPDTCIPRGRFRAEIGIDTRRPLAVCVGRFHEQKDHATLLRAWARVAAERSDAVLALVGHGPLEGSLREAAVAGGLQESVRFVPPRRDIGAVYRDADVLALTSLWEGLPYVVTEAQSFGIPVVATDVDGVPEVVADGITGYLVPPRDSARVASRILRLFADPERARAMGAKGRAGVIGRFSLDGMADGVAAVHMLVAG